MDIGLETSFSTMHFGVIKEISYVFVLREELEVGMTSTPRNNEESPSGPIYDRKPTRV